MPLQSGNPPTLRDDLSDQLDQFAKPAVIGYRGTEPMVALRAYEQVLSEHLRLVSNYLELWEAVMALRDEVPLDADPPLSVT